MCACVREPQRREYPRPLSCGWLRAGAAGGLTHSPDELTELTRSQEDDELARIKADRSGAAAVELLHSLDPTVVRRTVQTLSHLTDGSPRWTASLVDAGALPRLIAVARYACWLRANTPG
jgi:hypothetical protein